MALDITRWIGPLALFVDEGPMGDGHAYRGVRPPDATPLFVVVDAAGDAHEQAWRTHGAEVGALPRVVLRVGRTTAFELVPGVTLLDVQALTRESGAELPLEVALYVTVHVAQALERLHDVGSRPGPIDASCIRVGFEGRVVLFTSPWVANASGGVFDVSPLSGGAPPGSAPFEAGWAPEELAVAPVDPRRADVFRLGCLLHCLLDGVHPFDADTPLGALERAHRGSPEPLRRSVSDALAREMSRALRRDGAERHAGPLVFAKALRRAVDVDMQSARAATGGIARGLFPLAVEEQRLFLEELGAADLDLTVPDSAAAPVFDGRRVVIALLASPQLSIDRHVVTFGEFRAYLEDTGATPPPSFAGRVAELAHEPLTMIAPADIAGFAAWRGGRLPTEEEWVRGARCGTLADLTRVWEWTSTPANDGFRVRGGPWRGSSGAGASRQPELGEHAGAGPRVSPRLRRACAGRAHCEGEPRHVGRGGARPGFTGVSARTRRFVDTELGSSGGIRIREGEGGAPHASCRLRAFVWSSALTLSDSHPRPSRQWCARLYARAARIALCRTARSAHERASTVTRRLSRQPLFRTR